MEDASVAERLRTLVSESMLPPDVDPEPNLQEKLRETERKLLAAEIRNQEKDRIILDLPAQIKEKDVRLQIAEPTTHQAANKQEAPPAGPDEHDILDLGAKTQITCSLMQTIIL